MIQKIINTHHLSSEKERLKSELPLFKQSEDYKLYWLKRSRRKAQLNTHGNCAEYVQDFIEQEITAFTSTTPASITTSSRNVKNSSSLKDISISITMSDTTNTTTDIIKTINTTASDHQELFFAAIEVMTGDVENTVHLEPWIS